MEKMAGRQVDAVGQPSKSPPGSSLEKGPVGQQKALEDPHSFNQPSPPIGTGKSFAEQPAKEWTVSTATALYERATVTGEDRPLRRWRLRLRECVASFLKRSVASKTPPAPPRGLRWTYDSLGFWLPVLPLSHEIKPSLSVSRTRGGPRTKGEVAQVVCSQRARAVTKGKKIELELRQRQSGTVPAAGPRT